MHDANSPVVSEGCVINIVFCNLTLTYIHNVFVQAVSLSHHFMWQNVFFILNAFNIIVIITRMRINLFFFTFDIVHVFPLSFSVSKIEYMHVLNYIGLPGVFLQQGSRQRGLACPQQPPLWAIVHKWPWPWGQGWYLFERVSWEDATGQIWKQSIEQELN